MDAIGFPLWALWLAGLVGAAIGALIGFALAWWLYPKINPCPPEPPPPPTYGSVGYRAGNVLSRQPISTEGGAITMAVVQLKPNEKVPFSVAIKDAQGNNAYVQHPQWRISGVIAVVEGTAVPDNVVSGGGEIGGGPIIPPEQPGGPSGPPERPRPTPPTPGHGPDIPSVPGQAPPGSPEFRPPGSPGGPPLPGEPPSTEPPPGNLPPFAQHPDIGIPHPQPIGAREGVPQPSEYSITVKATGETGVGTVTFACDADLGEGQKLILATAEIAVAPGEAVVVELVPGTPVPA